MQHRGEAYLKAEQPTAALEDFNEAIKLDPNDADAYALRAQAYRQLGNVGQAPRDEAKARELENN